MQGYLNSHVLNHPGRGLQLLHPRRALSRCQSRHRLWTSRAWPEVVYERGSQKVSVVKNPSQKLVMDVFITSQKRFKHRFLCLSAGIYRPEVVSISTPLFNPGDINRRDKSAFCHNKRTIAHLTEHPCRYIQVKK